MAKLKFNDGTTTYTVSDDSTFASEHLGTAAAKDVPTSGNASTTQVVMGNDTRLSDSRTPSSHTHGNIQNGGTLQTNDITIASGDKLVVTDSSDSAKVARTSISFDGSTATQCLTKKGTWATFGTSNLAIGTTGTTAAAGNHTHTASIATSTGTNQLTMAANTKYSLTAGGSSYVFTTPPDTNTTYAAGTGVTITGNTNAINVTYGTAANTACQGNDSRLSNSRTPTAHASTATTYGLGSDTKYGHVKLSDSTTSSTSTNSGVAATPNAVYLARNLSRPFVVTVSSVSSLHQTISNSAITALMKVLKAEFSNPGASVDATVTTADGSATISGAISGTTDITLWLVETR